MRAQTVNESRKAQEYLAVGAVVAAAGVMFIAGSMQLTAEALRYTRVLAITMVVIGSVFMGLGLGFKPKMSSGETSPKATRAPKKVPVAAKAAAKKRNGRKK